MGGDLTYKCIGQDSFLVRLALYRDCSGISMGTQHTVRFSSPGCTDILVTVLLVPGSGKDITPLCPNWPSPCSGGSSSQLPVGVEEYIYEGILVIPPSSTCEKWLMSWTSCCRNPAITTISSPGSQSFYIHGDLYRGTAGGNDPNCPRNSSPRFANVPVPFVCVGQDFFYNHGVIDPDGDSLHFSLVPCRTTNVSTSVPYISPLTATQPLQSVTPITIDPRTGTIRFTPSTTQVGVLCVRVEEYRNGVKIGEVIRDIQIIVISCNNQPPIATPINGGTKFDTAICPGQGISFDILSSDPTPFQTVTMTWNQGIPGATYNISAGQYPTGTFSWNPTTADIGFHFFTVTVKDDGCPIIAQNTFAYSIEVRDPQIRVPNDLAICDGGIIGFDSSQVWMSVDFNQYTWTPATGVANPNQLYTTFNPTVSTTYTITATNGFCTATDTLRVNVDAKPTISITPPQPICLGDSGTITVTGNAAIYTWSNGMTGATIKVAPTQSRQYIVKAESAFGCVSFDTTTLIVNPPPIANAGPDKSVCVGNSVLLSGSGTGNQFRWEPAALLNNPNIAEPAATPATPGATVGFTLTVTDANGCSSTDDMSVFVLDLPQLNVTPDTVVNYGESIILTSGYPGASAYLWQPDLYLVPPSLVTDEEIEVAPTEKITYTVTVTDANGCISTDSVTISIRPGEVFVPNAFVPNSQVPENRKFYPIATGLITLEYFRIYNRWGQLIFESYTTGIDTGWDGRFKGEEAPPGVYTWVLKHTDKETDEVKVLSGNVTLIR